MHGLYKWKQKHTKRTCGSCIAGFSNAVIAADTLWQRREQMTPSPLSGIAPHPPCFYPSLLPHVKKRNSSRPSPFYFYETSFSATRVARFLGHQICTSVSHLRPPHSFLLLLCRFFCSCFIILRVLFLTFGSRACRRPFSGKWNWGGNTLVGSACDWHYVVFILWTEHPQVGWWIKHHCQRPAMPCITVTCKFWDHFQP